MKDSPETYVTKSFNDVAEQYDQIEFFKMSAQHLASLVEQHLARMTSHEPLHVLDVACGTGNAVLACAARLKEHPRDVQFKAIDVSEGMLNKAKHNAASEGLDIQFALEDMTKMKTSTQYDVITCAYALFFLPEPDQLLNTLYHRLKQGGCLVFTSFTSSAFQPAQQILLTLLREHGSISAQAYDSERWQNLRRTEDIQRLCHSAQLPNVTIKEKQIRYPMNLASWWLLMNNTGYKGMLMELSQQNYERVKQAFMHDMLAYLDDDKSGELVADTFYSILYKE